MEFSSKLTGAEWLPNNGRKNCRWPFQDITSYFNNEASENPPLTVMDEASESGSLVRDDRQEHEKVSSGKNVAGKLTRQKGQVLGSPRSKPVVLGKGAILRREFR
ncbi:hypothetical protein AMTR_s00030p00202430 [Amborella trichopoda]|uniref:Uncharacterized protein n=1 Tax=Amborella trichopoda TaxID=13333 RepID=U5CSB4_AMBTC|nr:hypothetical protein AMTR_s00030p00202430 [Amborella trichopoda]